MRVRLSQSDVRHSAQHDNDARQAGHIRVPYAHDPSHQRHLRQALQVLELGHLAVIELQPRGVGELARETTAPGVRIPALGRLLQVRKRPSVLLVKLTHEFSVEVGAPATGSVEVLDEYVADDEGLDGEADHGVLPRHELVPLLWRAGLGGDHLN